jgi:hypothetical protein
MAHARAIRANRHRHELPELAIQNERERFLLPPVLAPFVGLGFVAAAIIMSALVDGTAGVAHA